MREREKGIGKSHVHMWGKIIQQGNHPAREKGHQAKPEQMRGTHTFRDINDTRQNHPAMESSTAIGPWSESQSQVPQLNLFGEKTLTGKPASGKIIRPRHQADKHKLGDE